MNGYHSPNSHAALRPVHVVVVVLLAILVAALPLRTAANPLASVVVPTATEALRQAAQQRGVRYANDCATTRSPDDLGALCSKFVAQQGTVQAYLTGRTFSEFRDWVFVEQTPDGWQLLGTAPYEDAVTPPVIPWPSTAL
jgi:hypothetical protein